jgi:hypothetical protein
MEISWNAVTRLWAIARVKADAQIVTALAYDPKELVSTTPDFNDVLVAQTMLGDKLVR